MDEARLLISLGCSVIPASILIILAVKIKRQYPEFSSLIFSCIGILLSFLVFYQYFGLKIVIAGFGVFFCTLFGVASLSLEKRITESENKAKIIIAAFVNFFLGIVSLWWPIRLLLSIGA